MTFTDKESNIAKKMLRELLEEYQTNTVLVNQRHLSRSGMTRRLHLYVVKQGANLDNNWHDFRDITVLAAKALQWSYHKESGCIVVSGAGMDMYFHTVYSLSMTLYGEGLSRHQLDKAARKLQSRTI